MKKNITFSYILGILIILIINSCSNEVLDNSNSSQMPLVISTANKNCGLIESKLKDNDLQYFIFF